MPSTRARAVIAVGLAVKPVGKPDAGNPHVRFDERGRETGCCRMAQATAPVLDATGDWRAWLKLVSWLRISLSVNPRRFREATPATNGSQHDDALRRRPSSGQGAPS